MKGQIFFLRILKFTFNKIYNETDLKKKIVPRPKCEEFLKQRSKKYVKGCGSKTIFNLQVIKICTKINKSTFLHNLLHESDISIRLYSKFT